MAVAENTRTTHRLTDKTAPLLKGLVLVGFVAFAAFQLARITALPAMLLALVTGILLRYTNADHSIDKGVAFAAKPMLRVGVGLMGAQISLTAFQDLGYMTSLWVIGGVIATITCAVIVGRVGGYSYNFMILVGGATAICGASAAVAVSAVLPRSSLTDKRLAFMIVAATVMSTIAMISYPWVAQKLGMSELKAGLFLGLSIHDVAQVVGAGYSMSDKVGETATIVKLLRVSMLAPTTLIVSLLIWVFAKNGASRQSPTMPMFVLGFAALMGLNSVGYIPDNIAQALKTASQLMILMAVTAVGLQINVSTLKKSGRNAIWIVVMMSLFIMAYAYLATLFFHSYQAPGI